MQLALIIGVIVIAFSWQTWEILKLKDENSNLKAINEVLNRHFNDAATGKSL